MKKIEFVGVVGAGTMGAALAQKFAQEGFSVILVDRDIKMLDKGMTNIKKTLDEGMQRGKLTPEQVLKTIAMIQASFDLNSLKACNLIVEAIFENFEAKTSLYNDLNKWIAADCILASNTSSYSITELSKGISNPERFIGMHFFYHAAKNRLVEIIPGAHTSIETLEACKNFASLIGKDSIDCKDSYGFAVNRFFVPWLNESARVVEKRLATMEAVDKICMDMLGIGMGPFALMNATGVSIAYHSEKTLEAFGKLYNASALLKNQAESGSPWTIHTDSFNRIEPEQETLVRDRLLGVIFFICSQVLDESVCTATHLNRAAKIGLRWKRGPIDLMKSAGSTEVKRLVGLISNRYSMKSPVSIGDVYWEMHSVKLVKNNHSATITIEQPETLNALSENTVQELSELFESAELDPDVKTIFITGSGKAFVAGADIKFFIKNIKSSKLAQIETFTKFTQKVFDRIDKSRKQVIMIINGLALGGGLELALCADMILAIPSSKFAFPETGIGIYPALGGTQRSVRRIGKGLSKYLIHTGTMISAMEAEEIGLVDKIITLEEGMKILSETESVPIASKKTLDAKWKYISDVFEKNSLSDLQTKSFNGQIQFAEFVNKKLKSISHKAPIAIRIADKLIDEAKGCESELNYLVEIFSTSDALLGLTSIGQKILFQGK
jgi:enoyl-CoA hydratase/3-hydroxyacyl-CoA dehydrogenase